MAARDSTHSADEARKPIHARSVAWALTGVTAFVLAVGFAVVRTATPAPVPISDQIEDARATPPPPIVLQPRRVDRQPQDDPSGDAADAVRPPDRPTALPGAGTPRVAERPLPIAETSSRQ